MAIASNVSRNDYIGNGATDTYDYDFKINKKTDLKVIKRLISDGTETVLTVDTDYSVSGVGDDDGGQITLVAGDLDSTYALAILRQVELTQESDIRNEGDFYLESIEDQFDKQTMIDQQQQDAIDRSMRLPESINPSDFDIEFPAGMVGSVNKVPMTNDDGTGWADVTTWPSADAITSAQTEASNSAASASAAEASAVAAEQSAQDASAFLAAATDALDTHLADLNNPHAVTKAQVGLSNVDNTSDATKQSALATATLAFTNKDYDGGTASNSSRVTLPKAAKATLDALTRKAGTVVFDTDSLKAFIDNGSSLVAVGAGSSGKNYITDGDAEGSNIGTDYADASATPLATVTGTPTSTFVQSSTSPLSGNKSFLFTPGALGNGRAFAFTVDREDFGKVLTGKISIEIGGTGYTDGDIQFWIVAPSGAVIQPVGYKVLNSLLPQTHQFTFQAESSGTAYYLKMHQTTATSTYTVKCEFNLTNTGPARGPMISPWKSYTPTFSAGFGTVTNIDAKWRQNGDCVEIEGRFTTGTVAATEPQIGLPSGLTSASDYTTLQVVGHTSTQATGAVGTPGNAYVLIQPSKTYLSLQAGSTTTLGYATTTNSLFTNTATNSFYAKVRVLGWSSNSLLSSDEDGRVCAASYGITTSLGSTSAAAPLIFTTKILDTHNAYSTTTGKFSCPTPGIYKVTASGLYGNTTVSWNVYKNATIIGTIANSTNALAAAVPGGGALSVSCNAGDLLHVGPHTASTLNYSASVYQPIITFTKETGPSQIAASETVAARYYTTAGPTINTTPSAISFGTKSRDTHGSFSGSTFTAPIAGTYSVKAQLKATPAFGGTVNNLLAIYKNGSIHSANYETIASGCFGSWRVDDEVELLAGQTIQIYASMSTSTAALSTNAYENYVSIVRVGN